MKLEPEKPAKVEKPKSEAAERAVVKPQKVKVEPEKTEKVWGGGVDHFNERV